MGKYPLLLLMPVDAEGDRTDLSGLYLTSEKYIAKPDVLLSAGKGICIQASMKQFCAPEDSQEPLPTPTARGKLKGCQLAPGDLADAKHQLKLEHFLLPALLRVSLFEHSNNT